MARQVGTKITGTIDELTFYEINGRFYVRKKQRFDKKKYKTHPGYQRVRENNERFRMANQTALYLYRLLDPEERKWGVLGRITGWVYQQYKRGLTEDEIFQVLIRQYAVEQRKEDNAC